MASRNCDFLSTHRRKMMFFGGIGAGVAVILIGLLIGVTTLQIFEPDCIPMDLECTVENRSQNGTTPGRRCCSPYVCQSVGRIYTSNQSLVTGKCVMGNDQPNLTSTTTPRSTTPRSTTPRSTTPPGQCPYSSKLEQILEPVRAGDEFDKTLEFYKGAAEEYLRLSAYRGDEIQNFKLNVRELNTLSRKHYGTTTDNVGQNVFPLIVATEIGFGLDGIGSTFTIYYEDGSSQTISPVSYEYEIRKGLTHIPLGLYGIVVPYFRMPHAPGDWMKELEAFGEQVNETYLATQSIASTVVGAAESAMVKDSLKLLEISFKHISKWLDPTHMPDKSGVPKAVTVAEFQEYTAEIFPFVDRSIRIAATLQMRDVVPALKKWKEEMGDEKWKKVYAVIPTIWSVSAINPRFQALAEVMGPEQAKNQIFILENGGNVEQLRKILGKIIAQRTAANLIFGTSTPRGKEFTFSLSGQQDLMSIDAQDAINTFYRH